MDNLKVTFTLRGPSVISFQKACELSGLKACDFAKSASVSEMRKWMKTTDFQKVEVSSTGDLPRTRTGQVEDNLLSSDNKDDTSLEVNKFFRAFVGNINEKLFPERISKTIKENWSKIKDSGFSAVEMADKYNAYCRDGKKKTQNYKQPNSWLTDGGWANEIKEENDGLEHNYDY
ncbi:MAG: hypothetical protein CMC82_02570 [Flavobacteriaceae bacterium]|nr:hypothetical protein [Flavobacteriaceae bacterium]|tara:strand:+ start:643 stop:1167 length:525 start_codon:yes stop_codon:yes gene_type:complete